jgi:hypothetical protein
MQLMIFLFLSKDGLLYRGISFHFSFIIKSHPQVAYLVHYFIILIVKQSFNLGLKYLNVKDNLAFATRFGKSYLHGF